MELKPMKVLFGALANPSRLQLLELLRQGEKNVSELVRNTGLGQSLVSHYLKVLSEAGLVSSRTVGSFRVYTLDQKTAEPLLQQIETLASATSGRVKAQLAEVRARYDLLVETSPFAILLFRAGRIVFANASAMTMFGAKSSKDLLDCTVTDFVPRRLHETVQSYRRNLRRGEPMPLIDIRLKRRDGSEFDAEVEGAPIAFGDKYEIQLVVRDVTERLAMEAKLRDSEARMRLIMAQTPTYVLTVNRQLKCTYVNRVARGASRADAIGQDAVGFAVPESRPVLRAALKRAFKTGESQQILVRLFGRATGVCWYEIRIGALKAHGKVTELVAIADDVTEKVVTETLVRDVAGFRRHYQGFDVSPRRQSQ
jgi:PAS domain S-box-containing protein